MMPKVPAVIKNTWAIDVMVYIINKPDRVIPFNTEYIINNVVAVDSDNLSILADIYQTNPTSAKQRSKKPEPSEYNIFGDWATPYATTPVMANANVIHT